MISVGYTVFETRNRMCDLVKFRKSNKVAWAN